MKIEITLKQVLERHEMSQRELEKRINELLKDMGRKNDNGEFETIRFATINEFYLQKTKRVPLETLALMCKALNCQVQDILQFND